MPAVRPRLPVMRASAIAMTLSLAAAMPLTAQAESSSVVVTTEVLGSVVEQLVGDAAEVHVIMPGGANPHSYEPSARDAERMLNADVLVSNGLELEESLVSILDTAQSEGVTWFQAADHIAVRGSWGDDEQAEAEHGDAEHDGPTEPADASEVAHDDGAHDEAEASDEHDHGAEDPHIWTDPVLMIDIVTALEPVLAAAGIDASLGSEALISELEVLDTEIDELLSAVPEAERKMVTGHRSLGYFAERYGLELIGTVIPSLSTSGEPTARELAQLIEDIKANGVPVVFTEVGTPRAVAEAVAADSGAELVPLSTSQLPEGGTYQDLMRDIATTVADALAP